MTGSLYPVLGKYFKNETELAHAGCMSRTRLWECLNGRKDFTRAEKKAISAGIAMRLMTTTPINYTELDIAMQAWKGKFDEMYRRKDNRNV